MCDVREFTIIALRYGPAERRADVAALAAVDYGTDAEQVARGATVDRDDFGNVTGRMLSFSTYQPFSPEERLELRTRPTRVLVETDNASLNDD